MACMVCSMMTMVMPSCASARIMPITSSASPWPRPASVSSSSRRRGWPASARASSIRRSSLRGELAGEAIAQPAPARRGRSRPLRAGAPRASVARAHVGADHDVVGDRHARERPHDLEGAADAGRAQPVRLAADATSRPSSRTCPASGRRKPFSRLNSVVLPAPFGPMMPRIVPSRHVEADVLHRLQAAEALRQVAHLEDRPPAPSAVRRGSWLGGSGRAAGRAAARPRPAPSRPARQRRCTKSRTFQNTPSGAPGSRRRWRGRR